MKKTFKVIAVTASLLLAAASMSACGDSSSPASETESQSTSKQETKAAETEKTTKAAETTTESTTEAEENNYSFSDLDADFSSTINETVMVDESGVRITATSLEYTGYAAALNVKIENNTETDITVTAGTLGCPENAVNGYMVSDGYLNCDVAAGAAVADEISFSYDNLVLYGITDIADITIGFDIEGSDNKTILRTGPRKVETSLTGYDYGKDTFAEAMTDQILPLVYGYDVQFDRTDLLCSENGISIVSEVLITNQDGEDMLFIEVKNDSDNILYASTFDVSVNGSEVYSYNTSSETIMGGTRCILSQDIKYIADKIGIDYDSFENLTFTLQVKDDNYSTVAEVEGIEITK